MANTMYSTLLSTVGGYVGEDKARLALKRQLERVSATEDDVNASHVPKMLGFLMGAVMLYLPDKAKQAELKSKLQAMA